MAHEVVNGANGSVTWCGGPVFCQLCKDNEARTQYWINHPVNSTIVMPYSITLNNGRA